VAAYFNAPNVNSLNKNTPLGALKSAATFREPDYSVAAVNCLVDWARL